MTTPGGVPNLPAGGMTIETLAAKTQDMTQPAMRARAAERMPSIFDSSSGGNALSDLTPFGILTQLFAGFNSQVANGDPNDIQGPEDLPALLWAFIESLPVVGQFVDLVQAILGDYEGDDETFLAIQDIFTPIREVVERFADLLSGLGESTVGALVLRLLGIESTANTADSNATTGLGNWTSWLTGGSWANISASVADFLGTKSTANTASSNASTALGNFTSLISGAGESTLAAVASAIGSAKSNFTSLLSGMSVGSIGSLVSDLLGTKSTANTADTNATTGLGNWTSALSGSGDANAGALGSSLSTAKSNASTAIGNFTTLFSNFSVANLAAWSADLLGTKSTASTANSNASTALSNFTTILSGLGLGSIAAWISDLSGTKSTANTAASNASTALSNASTALTNVGNAFNSIVGGILGGSPTGQTATDAQAALAGLNGRVNSLAGGGVLTQYTSNGTWNKPTLGTDGVAFTADELFTIVCINGGQGGENGAANRMDNFKGGRNGGYVARKVRYADLASSYAMTIGAAGAANLGAGGVTSFGSLVVGAVGVGGEFREDGSYAVVTPPGDGGDGAAGNTSTDPFTPSSRGKSSAFAAGGNTAVTGTAQAGAASPVGVPSGGGGGGGGGLTTSTNGAGGPGGFPGGGGGAGSRRGGSLQNGAAGAAGCIYVIAPH